MRPFISSMVITYLFHLMCWVVAITLTILQIIKFSKNEDIVDISYKSFISNQDKRNYPVFSICLLNNPDNEFNETKLPENITSMDLAAVLNGNPPGGNDSLQKTIVVEEFLKDFSYNNTLSFDNILKRDAKNVFSGYRLGRFVPIKKNYSTSVRYIDNISLGMTGLTKKLESLNADYYHCRCWSRQFEYIPGQVIVIEYAVFAKGALFSPYFKNYIHGTFVSLHHENQLIRRFDTMINIADLINLVMNNTYKLPIVKISITQIKNVVRRHDANQECDPNVNNDDENFLQAVSKMLGCIPIFWKDQLEDWSRSTTMSFCTKVEQYHRYWSNYNTRDINMARRKDPPPCKKVSLTYDISTKEDALEYRYIEKVIGDLLIIIDYRTDEYEEIISHKKFTEETLFGQIGGLLGIMVGVSFVSIPGMLEKLFARSKRKFYNYFTIR